MLFLIGFAWLVAASFAFVLAMLTPNWVTFTKSDSSGSFTVQRGIFYVCDLLSSNQTFTTKRCVAMIDQTSSTDVNRWIYRKSTFLRFDYDYGVCYFSPSGQILLNYNSSRRWSKKIYFFLIEFATASAALAIACAGLSIIAIWSSGFYFQARRRSKRHLCPLFCISLLILITCKFIKRKSSMDWFVCSVVCTSFIVWILLISETLQLGVAIDRSIFGWPMWLAVGASGGYLMAFLTMILSCCTQLRRETKMRDNYYNPRNQF